MARPGPTPTSLVEVVRRARCGGFRVQSDFARQHAVAVAMAASLGYITTLREANSFGPDWYVTRLGMAFLDAHGEES